MPFKFNYRSVIPVVWLLLVIITSGCGTRSPCPQNRVPETVTYSGLGFEISIPIDVTVECKNPVEDFDIHRFAKNGKLILSIYSGNHPVFDIQKRTVKPKVYKLSGRKATSLDWQDTDNHYSRELLIELNSTFPNYLHAWYTNIDQVQKSVSDQMIHSIKRGSGKGCFGQ